MSQGSGTLKGLGHRCDQKANVTEDGSFPSGTSEEGGPGGSQHDNGSCASNGGHASEARPNRDFESQGESKGTEEVQTNQKEGGEKRGRYAAGVAVCILGAIISSLLQFVFVYGEVCFRALKNETTTDRSLYLRRKCQNSSACSALPRSVSLMLARLRRRSGCRLCHMVLVSFSCVSKVRATLGFPEESEKALEQRG